MDADLQRARKHIDQADKKIIDALKERMYVVENEIKPLKKAGGLDSHDEKRVEEILETRASGSTLNGEFVRELFRLIVKESERLQNK